MMIVANAYLFMSVFFLSAGVVINWRLFVNEINFLLDHLDQDLWGSDLLESKLYLLFAGCGAILGILVVFALRSLLWPYLIFVNTRQYFRYKREEAKNEQVGFCDGKNEQP